MKGSHEYCSWRRESGCIPDYLGDTKDDIKDVCPVYIPKGAKASSSGYIPDLDVLVITATNQTHRSRVKGQRTDEVIMAR
jgi:hypothetical protein